METRNNRCITGVDRTVCDLLGVRAHRSAGAALPEVEEAAERAFEGHPCDRVVLYNPDAIAQWVFEKYRDLFAPALQRSDLVLPMESVFPPVTPVCFASMYTGLYPEGHGILKYVKPVLRVPTLFDDLPRAGKRCAIVSTKGDSISKIFLKRDADYYIYGSIEEVNRKAMELIREDASARDPYSCIVIYNGDYDYWMHRTGPCGKRAVRALEDNIGFWCRLYDSIREHWEGTHRTALAFAMDHGCHEDFPLPGNHGIDRASDMNICHLWSFLT